MASEQKPLKLTVKLAEEIIRSQFGDGPYDFGVPVCEEEVAAILDPVLQKHLRLLRGYQKVLKVKYGPGVGDWSEVLVAIHELEGDGDGEGT